MQINKMDTETWKNMSFVEKENWHQGKKCLD